MLCSFWTDYIVFKRQRGECLWKVARKYTLLKDVWRKLSIDHHRLAENMGDILKVYL
jgi:hypothetical protein